MRTVWKYPLGHGKNLLPLWPEEEVVHVGRQSWNEGSPATVWVDVDTSVRPATSARELHVIGTGSTVPDGGVHVGTVVTDSYVWHVYEVP